MEKDIYPLFFMKNKKSNSILNCSTIYQKIPNKTNIQKILKNLFKLIYPGYFEAIPQESDLYLTNLKNKTELLLAKEMMKVHRDATVCHQFMCRLEMIKSMIEADVNAMYEGDPAANSYEEIILTYPGIYAITVYRIAHELYLLQVPMIPRMLSEMAHSKTGIDIHPGATIGKNFFIDHGTGIVIGETTQIGDNVKIYQGVTLGAISLKKGQELKGSKRHPTIKNNVTIYAGASILGGNTLIGNNVTIGSNVFITESIEDNQIVILKQPDLVLKDKK